MFQGLAAKFSIGVFIFVSLLFAAYSSYDYVQMNGQLTQSQNEKIELVANSVTSSIAVAMWNYDAEAIETVLKNTTRLPDVAVIGIKDAGKGKLTYAYSKTAEGGVKTVDSIDKNHPNYQSFDINFTENGQTKTLGQLLFIVDNQRIKLALGDLVVQSILKAVLSIVLLVSIIVLLMKKLVSNPIAELMSSINTIFIEEGNLKQRLPEHNKNEIGELSKYINYFVSHMEKMVHGSVKTGEVLSTSVNNLEALVRDNASLANQQHREISDVVAAVHQMNESSSILSDSAKHAASSTKEANSKTDEAMLTINQTVKVVSSLANDFVEGTSSISSVQNRVNDIGAILDVIRGIAEQTNLLALNAAIEAARAGEQGRGFAVVADEVRALAGRTQQSTGEIQAMIERLQASADKAVSVMDVGSNTSKEAVNMANSALENLSIIAGYITELNKMNTQTAGTSEDLSAAASSVRANIEHIASLATQSNEVVSEVSSISGSIKRSSEQFSAMIGRFKV